jgi:hypothetical protein
MVTDTSEFQPDRASAPGDTISDILSEKGLSAGEFAERTGQSLERRGRRPDMAAAGESLVWALARETGRFESRLRCPGGDDVCEKPVLDRPGL